MKMDQQEEMLLFAVASWWQAPFLMYHQHNLVQVDLTELGVNGEDLLRRYVSLYLIVR